MSKEIKFESKFWIPSDGYEPILGPRETNRGIHWVHKTFVPQLEDGLKLERATAPLFLEKGLGFNDDLQGWQKTVEFDIPAARKTAEMVQSLAKWKPLDLWLKGYLPGEGIYTDMSGVRAHEDTLDNTHSAFVDQWDWEKVITSEDRTMDYLHATIRKIAHAMMATSTAILEKYPQLEGHIPHIKDIENMLIVDSSELEKMPRYKYLPPKAREHKLMADQKHNGITAITGIGGGKHGDMTERAPDYDHWGLNADIFLFDKYAEYPATEISSMGIRARGKEMEEQLRAVGLYEQRAHLPYHQLALSELLPYTIGGGIGQSRLCKLMLGKLHIDEVQSSVTHDDTMRQFESLGIPQLGPDIAK